MLLSIFIKPQYFLNIDRIVFVVNELTSENQN